MPTIKHALFKIPLNGNGSQNLNESAALEKINEFLSDPKFSYMHHSMAISKTTELRNPFHDATQDEKIDIGTHRNTYTNPTHLNNSKNPQYVRYVNSDFQIIISLVYQEFNEEELGIEIEKSDSSKKVRITGSSQLDKPIISNNPNLEVEILGKQSVKESAGNSN